VRALPTTLTRVLVTLTLVSIAAPARAAGFSLDVQSARGTGMASAMTAFIDDSSAVFFNPAGIAQGKILDAQLGVTMIAPKFTYTNRNGDSTDTTFRIVPPVNAYVSGGITDNLSLGLGLTSPFGSTLGWPKGWEGRRLITEVSIQTFNLNPTAAYRIGPVRLGAGLQVMRGTVHLQRQIAFGETEGSSDIGAGTWGVGANIGAQVEAIPKLLSFGAHYRSAVKLSFDGLAHFENVPEPLRNAIHDQRGSTSLLTPDTFALGAAVRPTPSLLLAADVVWYGWANFRSVDIHFPDDASNTLSTSTPKSWHNVVNYHLGAEAAVSDAWRVRGGLIYDPSPSPKNTLTPDSPDADRVEIALGGSYLHASGFRAEVGYRLVVFLTKDSTAPELPGQYGGFANVLGLSLGYRTPAKPRSPAR